MVGISIDSPQQHAAWINKLQLPFPLLSDPDRTQAIMPYGVADENDERNIARPAAVIISPEGEEAFRLISRDFADRPIEDELIDALRELELSPTEQATPRLGPAEAGPNAMALVNLLPYYRGAKFAVKVMGSRFSEAQAGAEAYMAQLDRYSEAVKKVYKATRQD